MAHLSDGPLDLLILESPRQKEGQLSAQLSAFGYTSDSHRDLQSFLRVQAGGPARAWVVEDDQDLSVEEMTLLLRTRTEGTRLVLISSRNDLPARLQALRSGCDAYLTHPLEMHTLASHLEKLLSPVDPTPERILLVEDSRGQVQHLTSILESAGMVVKALTDPAATLNALAEFHPDLILLDLHMPTCTGTELAGAIRLDPSYVGIPIVFLSAELERNAQLQALEQGGDDFLTKPIVPHHLITLVRIRAERTRLLRSLMTRDSLTGLPNHSAMKSRLEEEWSRFGRTGTPFTFAMLDIDHFKLVNDTHGHPVGDRVLQSLSRFLTRRLRRTDVVARLGGEEFGVLFSNTPPEICHAFLDRVREDFGQINHLTPSGHLQVTFSAGLGAMPGPFTSPTALWERADEALYQAKHGGRNRVIPWA